MLCIWISLSFVGGKIFPLYALDLVALDKPIMTGPQYSLYSLITTYQPDTAFLLKQYQIGFQISQIKSNSFEFSSNSAKHENKDADPSEFINDGSSGYSVYIDIELRTTRYQMRIGLTDWLEMQYMKQTAGIENSVSMDTFIENFHNMFGLGNYERDRARQGKFDYYVYDNETGEYVIESSSPKAFEEKVDTYALKLSVFQTESVALSLKYAASNFHFKTEGKTNYQKEFADRNLSCLFSLRSQYLTIHTATSVTYLDEPIFKKSPKEIYYSFLGLNFHIAESWDLILQGLKYRSIYPYHDEGNTSLSDDIIEATLGVRWYWEDFFSIDFAVVENVTNAGPSNIDVAFYGSMELVF